MSLLVEELVEEWLNRKGFFTIRGVKEGVDEMDLLSVQRQQDGSVEGWHVEVQASFRPATYFTNLTPELAKKHGVRPSSGRKREPEELAECVRVWVEKKFDSPKKVNRRTQLWSGVDWKRIFVHGRVKHAQELALVGEQDVQLCSLRSILDTLCSEATPEFTGASGGDLTDVIAYYAQGAKR